jgi:prevent-host-death family protein
MYNPGMAKEVIHISETDAERNFASLLARVRAGAEVVIEHDAQPVAVVLPAEPHVRLLSESLRLAKEHGSAASSTVTSEATSKRLSRVTVNR